MNNEPLTSAMRQAGIRLRLIDYGCENGFVFKRTFRGKSPARRIAAERLESFNSLLVTLFDKSILSLEHEFNDKLVMNRIANNKTCFINN